MDHDRHDDADDHGQNDIAAEDPRHHRFDVPYHGRPHDLHDQQQRGKDQNAGHDDEHHRREAGRGNDGIDNRLDGFAAGLDRPLDRAVVFGTTETADQRHQGCCRLLQHAGEQLERQQNKNGKVVEEIVTRCYGKRSPKFLLPSHVRQCRDRIRDGGADVGSHDHRHGVHDGKRIVRRRNETHDHRRGHRRALHERRSQDPDHQTHERVVGGGEKGIEQPPAERLKSLAEPVDTYEKHIKQHQDFTQAGKRMREPRCHRRRGL